MASEKPVHQPIKQQYVIEFFRQIFLIINKKSVSFLHAYHHVSVCVLWWIIVKWHPGTFATFNLFSLF
jgi:elongation of very long chain fatty acids protein 4